MASNHTTQIFDTNSNYLFTNAYLPWRIGYAKEVTITCTLANQARLIIGN